MKRKRVLLLLCILSCTLQLFAQQINVQGVVYDPSGETVPGAVVCGLLLVTVSLATYKKSPCRMA